MAYTIPPQTSLSSSFAQRLTKQQSEQALFCVLELTPIPA